MYESKGMKDGHKVPEGEYQFRLEYRSNTCVDNDIITVFSIVVNATILSIRTSCVSVP